jgi:3-hydroxybutyryl-CoA dehydrogenase
MNMSGSDHVAVIGAGLMGHGIAQVFAGRGNEVFLYDVDAEILNTTKNRIEANLKFLAANGMGTAEQIAPTLELVRLARSLADAVSEARLVIEAVVEKLPVKQDLFEEMERSCPPATILATNTSVISITEIAAKCRGKERVIGTHFWNPPFLIPLVEVVPGRETAPETVERTFALLAGAGKHPVRVKKDVPGFVANRMQHALWREAISIVENGIADAATVDECVKYSFGLRLPVLGPLENADLVGTDLTLAIHNYVLKHIESSPLPSPYLQKLVDRGDLGFKSGKGFSNWDQKKIETVRERLFSHLIASQKSRKQNG